MTMFRSVFGHLSPAGPSARLTVLIFHRVLAEPDPLFPDEVDAQRFDRICGWLARWFDVLPLDDAATRLREGRLPARAAAITFDDGYRDNHDVALPVLRRHGLPATFFVATGFLDGGRMWNDVIVEALRRSAKAAFVPAEAAGCESLADLGRLPLGDVAARRRAIDVLLPRVKYRAPDARLACAEALAAALGPRDDEPLMMSSDQVTALHRAGMQVGAHTVSHPILARLEPAAAAAELASSRTRLETLTDAPVTLFAYPNGKPGDDYDAGTVELVRRAGFAAAVSTTWGAAATGDDLWQLPRFTPWDRSRLGFGTRLAANLRSAARARPATAG